MSTIISTLLIVLLAGACVFLYAQYQIELKKATEKGPFAGVSVAVKPSVVKPASSTTEWKAVKVKTGLMCCKQAENIRDQVYLVADAPTFPLARCEVEKCECRYLHIADRREEDDRRESTNFNMSSFGAGQNERRKLIDRRRA